MQSQTGARQHLRQTVVNIPVPFFSVSVYYCELSYPVDVPHSSTLARCFRGDILRAFLRLLKTFQDIASFWQAAKHKGTSGSKPIPQPVLMEIVAGNYI